MMKLKIKIYVAGHTGLLEAAIIRKLKSALVLKIYITKSQRKLDLKIKKKFLNFLKK